MSQTLEFKIDDRFHNKRLDAALSGLAENISRSVLKGYIDEGRVSVDGEKITKASFKLSSGMTVTLEQPDPPDLDAVPQDLPLDIIYRDDDVLVINKPIGFVVHPGAGCPDGTVMNAVLWHFPQTKTLPRAGIVHRLDKDTSGLMVIALTETAQHKLVKAISKHEVVREYVAVAEGLITAGGTVDREIGRDPYNRIKMCVMPDGFGREAVTHYRVVEQFREHTLLKLRLETGRTHQIRVHMAYLHHPLLGDAVYGVKRQHLLPHAAEELSETLRQYRHQALHAAHIEFTHPVSGQTLAFDAPLPSEFMNLIRLLREDRKENGID